MWRNQDPAGIKMWWNHDSAEVWNNCYVTEWKFLMSQILSLSDGNYLCSSWFHEQMEIPSSNIIFRLVVSKNGLFHYELSRPLNIDVEQHHIRPNKGGLYRVMFQFYLTDHHDQSLPDTPEKFWMDIGHMKYRLWTILKSNTIRLSFDMAKFVTVRATFTSLRNVLCFKVMEERLLTNFEWHRYFEQVSLTCIPGQDSELGNYLFRQAVEKNPYCDICVEILSPSDNIEYLYAHKCVLDRYAGIGKLAFRKLFFENSEVIVRMHFWPRSVIQVLFSLIYLGKINWCQLLDNEQEIIWWTTTEIPWLYLISFAHMYELETIFEIAVINAFRKISIPYKFSPYDSVKQIKAYAVFLYHLDLYQLADRYLAILEFLDIDCEDIPCSEFRKRQIRNRNIQTVCMNGCKHCYNNYSDERYLIIL